MVKGYFQQFGVDFNETFGTLVKSMAFRVFFAIAALFNLDIEQIDIKIAFLYGFINQLIYIDIPKELETEVNCNMVYKLLKAFYNIKPSPQL